MDIILLKHVKNLGFIGDILSVKAGYARNYLFPQGLALFATKENKEEVKKQQKILEAKDLEFEKDAQQIAQKLEPEFFPMFYKTTETLHLYAAVSPKDVQKALKSKGFFISSKQVSIPNVIKTVGDYEITISLHPKVEQKVRFRILPEKDRNEAELLDPSKPYNPFEQKDTNEKITPQEESENKTSISKTTPDKKETKKAEEPIKENKTDPIKEPDDNNKG